MVCFVQAFTEAGCALDNATNVDCDALKAVKDAADAACVQPLCQRFLAT